MRVSILIFEFLMSPNVHHGVSVKNQILSPDTSVVFGKSSPGTMTEANACHNKVSIAAMATLLVSAPGSLMEEIDWVNLSQRLTSYLTLFHPFVISICQNIGWCNSIGGPHPSFEWSVEQLQLLRNCIDQIPDMHKSSESFPNLIGISKVPQGGIPKTYAFQCQF